MSKHRTLTIFPKLAQHCNECGCNCSMCSNNSLDLHSEIEELKSRVSGHKSHVSQLELELSDTKYKAEQETAKLQEELSKLRERYDRLLDSQKKLQKLNNNLEDKLLTVVEKLQKEKDELLDNVGILTSKLSDASVLVEELEDRCIRYQSDCNVAVQLLQCKPSEFVAHKLNTLPLDLQDRVRSFLTKEELEELEDTKNEPSESSHAVHLPMSTFPPTAVFSAPSNPVRKYTSEIDAGRNDSAAAVPMSLIAKALRSNDRPLLARPRHICSSSRKCDAESQTVGLPEDCGQSRAYYLQDQPHTKNSLSGPPGVHKASKLVSNSR